MTTGERLVSISTLSTGTALDHFLNISTGSAEIVIRTPLVGNVQKIDLLNGIIQKVPLLDGVLQKIDLLYGVINKTTTLEGVLNKNDEIKGEIKCQK